MNIIVTSYDTNQEFVFCKQITITQNISNKNDNNIIILLLIFNIMFTLVVYFKRIRNLWKSDCFIKCRHWNVFEWLFKHDKRSEIILYFVA